MPNPKDFDLNFRPKTYWDNAGNGFATIKGEMRRRIIENAFAKGKIDFLPSSVFSDELSDDERLLTTTIHPSFMGGEYLPTYLPGEVEIARVALASVMWDVMCILARVGSDGLIYYRIVDEYQEDEEGRYIYDPKSSQLPLTLGEIVSLMDNAVLKEDYNLGYKGLTFWREHNYDIIGPGKIELEELVNFVTVSSFFYPGLELWYEIEAAEWFTSHLAELDLEDKQNTA